MGWIKPLSHHVYICFRAVWDTCGTATATFPSFFLFPLSDWPNECSSRSNSKEANICFRMFIIYLWQREKENVVSACLPGSWLARPRNAQRDKSGLVHLHIHVDTETHVSNLDSPEASRKVGLLMTSLKPVPHCFFFFFVFFVHAVFQSRVHVEYVLPRKKAQILMGGRPNKTSSF